jgi:hypothetical protein
VTRRPLNSPALAQELRTHLQGRPAGLPFESNRQTLYSVRTVQAVVKRFAQQAGIAKRVYPHLLRHSIATILLDSGLVPIDQVQKFLGHLQLSTTQIYAETSTRALGETTCALWRPSTGVEPMAPTATTVPVEQESSAARLEAAEQLPETLDPESLRKYFTLTETDLQEVAVCRGVVNKLGFAVQLCTLRWQGYFLGDTRGLPAPVLETLARQLGLLAMSIDDYPQNEKTRWEHLERIRQHLRFQQCDDFQRRRLLKHLTETAQALPRSDALRQEAWPLVAGAADRAPGPYDLARSAYRGTRRGTAASLRVAGSWIDCGAARTIGRFAGGTFRR